MLSASRLAVVGEAPPERAHHAGAMVERDVLVINGGENDDLAMADTWAGKVSEDAVTWTRVGRGSETFHPRQGHAAAAHDGKCILFGGVDMMKTFDGHDDSDMLAAALLSDLTVSELHILDLRGSEEWVTPKTSGRRPTARGNQGLVVHHNVLYVYGGFDGIQHLNDMYALDLRALTWQLLLPHAADRQPYPVSQHVLLPWDDKLVSLGGMSSANHESDSPVNTIDFFSCKDQAWDPARQDLDSQYRRSTPAACVLTGKSPAMLVVGGWTAEHSHSEIASEAFWYSLEDKRLLPCTTSKGTEKDALSRVGLSLSAFGQGQEDECYMFGGWDGFFNRYNDLYRVKRE